MEEVIEVEEEDESKSDLPIIHSKTTDISKLGVTKLNNNDRVCWHVAFESNSINLKSFCNQMGLSSNFPIQKIHNSRPIAMKFCQ